jgi:hypothetical protein
MPALFGAPELAASGDGRLELFVFDIEGELWHIWQTAWSNGLSGWSLQGSVEGASWPATVAPSGDGRLELFVAAGTVAHQWQTAWSNGWSQWLPHGSPPGGVLVVGPVEAARSADGRVVVFVVDDDGSLWKVEQTAANGSWSDWGYFGSVDGGQDDRPALARSADGRLELFVRRNDGALWHRWQTAASNGWSPWTSEGSAGGGFTDAAPGLGRSGDGRLELFVVGRDGGLWHKWQTAASNGWSAWASHGHP